MAHTVGWCPSVAPTPNLTWTFVNDYTAPTRKHTHPCCCVQAAVRGLMSREHQMLTWHTIAGDLEAKQKALAEADKSKVGCGCALLCCRSPLGQAGQGGAGCAA